MIGPTALDRTYTVKKAEVLLRSRAVYDLMLDIKMMIDIVKVETLFIRSAFVL